MSSQPASLVERLRQGDAGALGEFVQAHRPQLLAFIERSMSPSLRAKVEPQDVLQEASLSAIHALAATDLSGRDPFGWLCRLAEERIIDAHRRYFGTQK